MLSQENTPPWLSALVFNHHVTDYHKFLKQHPFIIPTKVQADSTGWFPALGFTRQESRCQEAGILSGGPREESTSELIWVWQNSDPCSCRTEVFVFWLWTRGHFQLLEAIHSSLHRPSYRASYSVTAGTRSLLWSLPHTNPSDFHYCL